MLQYHPTSYLRIRVLLFEARALGWMFTCNDSPQNLPNPEEYQTVVPCGVTAKQPLRSNAALFLGMPS
jgi:hypothetical protein